MASFLLAFFSSSFFSSIYFLSFFFLRFSFTTSSVFDPFRLPILFVFLAYYLFPLLSLLPPLFVSSSLLLFFPSSSCLLSLLLLSMFFHFFPLPLHSLSSTLFVFSPFLLSPLIFFPLLIPSFTFTSSFFSVTILPLFRQRHCCSTLHHNSGKYF